MEKKYHSPGDYLAAAKSPRTSVEELEFLVNRGYDFVTLAVVKNKNATSGILRAACPEDFYSWNAQEIAGEIGSNPKTPHETLRKIAKGLIPVLNNKRENDHAPYVSVRFCNNEKTPIDIIKVIVCSMDVAIGIRKKIATNVSRIDVLKPMLANPRDAVKRSATNNLAKRGILSTIRIVK